MKQKLTLGLTLICVLVSLAHARVVTSPASHTPMNLLGETALLRHHHDSGRYMADIAYVDGRAEKFRTRRLSGRTLALVLDIDEAALSSWPEMAADDFAYFPHAPCRFVRGRPSLPCGALAWDRLEKSAAIRPTLPLFDFAQAHGVRVFFITGRYASERAVTTENLVKAGYVGWNPKNLLMEPNGMHVPSAADFKAAERKWIEYKLGYTIVMNVSDQRSDLAGGYSEGEFKLPNPFYGIP